MSAAWLLRVGLCLVASSSWLSSWWMLSRSYFELNLYGVAAPSWTLSRDLYGVATSSWTLSRGYFELVFVLAKLFAAVSGALNLGFCGDLCLQGCLG